MSDDAAQPLLRVVAGSPTDEETAAVAVLLQQLLLERAASSLPLPVGAEEDAWIRTGRAVRKPLDRRGGWRNP